MNETLIATLGKLPQVVTITLDLLLAKGHQIDDVIVVHTGEDTSEIGTALGRLDDEFDNWYAADPKIELHKIEIRQDDKPVADIENEIGARATFATIWNIAIKVKSEDTPLHLSISGGRKAMSVYGMTTAQLLFNKEDHLWHLVSYGKLLEEGRMHPEPDDECALIPIPVIRWSNVPLEWTELGRITDPQQVADAINSGLEAVEVTQAREFIEKELTSAERKVAAIIAQEDWSYQEIAQELSLSIRTIDRHVESIRRKLIKFYALEKAPKTAIVRFLHSYYE